MDSTKLDLGWLRFSGKFIVSLLAISGGVAANLILLADRPDAWAFAKASNLVLLPIITLMIMSRVPYRTDEFERRLRNWSMTQAAVWVLVGGVIGRLLSETSNPNQSHITIYILPGVFFLTQALYSQYLRFRISTGGKNAFSDGSC